MILTELVRSGDFSGTIHSALFGHAFADRVLNLSPSPRSLMISAGFIALSFPNLLLPAAVYGIVRAARFDVPVLSRRVLLAGLVIHVCFVGRYNVVDQHIFLVPFYVLLSMFSGIGFAGMLQRWRPPVRRIGLTAAVVLLVLTPIVYAVVPTVARRFDVLRSAARHKPYRDDYVYLFTPWSVVERSAERMSREAVTLAGDRGLILVEDGMAEFAIRYRALREGLDRLRITRDSSGDVIREQSGAATSVVLVPLSPDRPRISTPVGSWRRIGDLYVLSVDRSGPATAPQSEE